MAINIPDSVFTKYEEFANAMISNFGVVCTLVYPSTRGAIYAPSVTAKPPATLGRRSPGIYTSGGPQSRGTDFPLGYAEYKDVETTEEITLRVYWNPKDWMSVGFQVQIPNNTIQVIGYMSDLPKIEKATKLIVHKGIEGHGPLDFEKESEPYPFGLRQKSYFAMFWKRS